MVVAKYTKPNILMVNAAEDIALAALEGFVEACEKAIAEKGVFQVAISGGHTPELFFKFLGDTETGRSIKWDKVQIFWVDERCVEPYAEASNYAMAAHAFLDKVNIPLENVHRVSGEAKDYSVAVAEYEETIRKVFDLAEGEFPSFDLMILGMGDDGHIGSLFPNSNAHFDTQDIVTAVYLMSGDFNRITLTHPVICEAKQLFVLVSGEKKAVILKEVLEAEPDEVRYPIHSLWPILDKVKWIIDNDAGKLLTEE
ncbi:MAG: 6-phosphogluconolactonase [Phycisphaerae bacterium]|nr:6-phosphogluconolactonase [Phycisphaerae bacterium]